MDDSSDAMRTISSTLPRAKQTLPLQRALRLPQHAPQKKVRDPEHDQYWQWLHFGPYSWDISLLKEGDIVRGEIRSINVKQQIMMVDLVGVHRTFDNKMYRATGVVEFRNDDPTLMQVFSPTMGIPLELRYLRTLDRDLDATLSYEDYQKRSSAFDAKYDAIYSSSDTHLHLRFFHRILAAIDDVALRHPSGRVSFHRARTADELIHQCLADKFPDKIDTWKQKRATPEIRHLPRDLADTTENGFNSHSIAVLALGLAEKGFCREAGDFVARHLNEFGQALVKNLIRYSVENHLLLTGPFYRLLEPRFRKDFLREVVKFFGDTRQFPHLRYSYLHTDLKL